MFTKRTVIGIVIGAAIIGIGAAALVQSIGLQTLELVETIEIGTSLPYTISAPAGTPQSMTIIGDRFHVELSSPGDDLQLQDSYEDELDLQWVHAEDGTTHIKVQNTGGGELIVTSTLMVSTDPILYAYHFIVIIAGLVIIGFSLGFSFRRPRGF